MGTRHLTAAVIDGQFKIAQYGQWDGYPSGQGATVAEFFQGLDVAALESALRKVKFITEAEWTETWRQAGQPEGETEIAPPGVPERWAEANPQLSRSMGAEVLQFVLDRGGDVTLNDNAKFAWDSLYCEFAYCLNCDKKRLEIYRGFQKAPSDGENTFVELLGLPTDADTEKEPWMKQYAPVKLVGVISFTDCELMTAASIVEKMEEFCGLSSDDDD